jgi:hypothetical protein
MITQLRLKELLDYNPDTGIFVWKVARQRIRVGSVAGTKNQDGYIEIKIKGKIYKAHRLAWLYIYGVWPAEIDHRFHDRSDNRIAELRDVTESGNQQNLIKATVRSVSGLLGVCCSVYKNGKPRYQAMIMVKNKGKYLGTYPTPEAAHQAYLVAKRALHETCVI